MDMVNLLFASFILLSVAALCYLLRFPIRRWWRAIAVKRDLPPHQRWPEILHWRAGDDFNGLLWVMRHDSYKLVALQEDGYAVVDWCGEREWAPISSLIGRNVSLRTRRVNESLKQSAEYMELLNQFNIAYRELQERDKKLKLVS